MSLWEGSDVNTSPGNWAEPIIRWYSSASRERMRSVGISVHYTHPQNQNAVHGLVHGVSQTNLHGGQLLRTRPTSKSRTTAPRMATIILVRLKPVTPWAPNTLFIRKPPIRAPT